MANMIDAEERLNQLNLDLLSAEKRQTLELQKIERLVKKSELQLAKFQEQLRNNELRIHAWMLQKSRSNNPGIKVIPDIYFGVARPISSFTHSKYLVDAPFKISDKCCDFMKKEPASRYEKETKRKGEDKLSSPFSIYFSF
jgi:hypothetical protein